jgi:enamine deaminase RidA (YjgF/YER057c/UK114 family)
MTAPVEVFETERERGLRFPAGMSIADRIKAATEYFDASLEEDLAQLERDFRAGYVVDDEATAAMLSLVRAKAAVRRADLIARIATGAMLQ